MARVRSPALSKQLEGKGSQRSHKRKENEGDERTRRRNCKDEGVFSLKLSLSLHPFLRL